MIDIWRQLINFIHNLLEISGFLTHTSPLLCEVCYAVIVVSSTFGAVPIQKFKPFLTTKAALNQTFHLTALVHPLIWFIGLIEDLRVFKAD